jgi:hypothetical protein
MDMISEVEFSGWRCAELRFGSNLLYVSLDFGPRILGLVPDGEENLFYTKEQMHGKVATDYAGYGGHRLWTSPEIVARTYEPDNEPVLVEELNGAVTFTTSRSAIGLLKEIKLEQGGNGILITHTVTNTGDSNHRIAPWAITVMRAGGTCYIPTPEYVSHTEVKLPSIPVVLWPYTSMADPRFTWGRNMIALQQTSEVAPQKFGAFVPDGIAAYLLDEVWFVKRFHAEHGEEYPDFGCNFEAYTRNDMLEVETLGPLADLRPGESVSHVETWFVLSKNQTSDDPVELRAFWTHLQNICPLV